jgi:hypothetical protein
MLLWARTNINAGQQRRGRSIGSERAPTHHAANCGYEGVRPSRTASIQPSPNRVSGSR